jgi:hypothetical protein
MDDKFKEIFENFAKNLKASYRNQDNSENKQLTRLEVRDANGKMLYQVKNRNIELSFQDDGQTLKITIYEDFTSS